MDATTLSANFEARERATAELRSLTEEFAGKEMDADARSKETALLGAIADYDGRIKRGIEVLKSGESVSALMAGLNGTGSAKAKRETQDKLAQAAEQLRSLKINEGLTFAPEAPESRAAIDTKTNPGNTTFGRTLYGRLLAQAVERSTIMRGGATILTTSAGEPMDFTVVTGRAAASIVTENAAVPESNPTTVQRSVGAYKYGYASTLSTEFVQDQALDLVSFLVGDAGPAIGAGMGAHFLTGTGTNQPRGIITAGAPATATFTPTAKDATVSDALIDLFYELPSSYRASAAFVVSDKVAAQMRKLKDGQGQYLWQSSVIVGAPDTFNGRPVLTDVGVPDDKVTFGDLSKYTVRLAGPLRVERSVDLKFLNDQIVYRFLQRADGLLVDERAVKVLTVKAGA
ncbi:phage major capsid protein [Streptomyces sp. TRM66268-LWL]|uniref:Phage major capsid protein n=1 Tax=Streptomyces polyasparticus TaxID=2767826 RepID=A0ABR7SGZ7_9ACTN|nr:phage major capsid protein [Streptomyces polyasparticus]MBC9714499.1 phage major capsid protein [Streptomyces polyasparticus]